MRTKLYVGLTLDCTARRQVFRSATTPTEASHGKLYGAVIGPFRTRRGADFMAMYGGSNNPHLCCVADAERLSSN